MNMNDYPSGPHRFEGATSEQRIAELEKELYLVRADAKQAMFEAEKAMAQIREATAKLAAERDTLKEDLRNLEDRYEERVAERDAALDKAAQLKQMLFRAYDYVGVPDDKHAIWGPVRALLIAKETK